LLFYHYVGFSTSLELGTLLVVGANTTTKKNTFLFQDREVLKTFKEQTEELNARGIFF
jgi:hypothetical protein